MPEKASDFSFATGTIETPRGKGQFYNITKLTELGLDAERLPYSIRVLLENVLRHAGRVDGAEDAVHELVAWPRSIGSELPFMPSRVLLQDYTGVPLIVDLAAMRDAMKRGGNDPLRVNSRIPVDLVIDHSVQVDSWGNSFSFFANIEKEYERNGERYQLLKWAQDSFRGMRIFPPGKGICHQVNLEYLATVASTLQNGDGLAAIPDTLVGTDSHTTMVNGLGVLGWGVGGIEAEAVMLGEPYHMPIPKVVGVKLTGTLPEGSTPTDLVLAVTELLRGKDVVGAFVEYFGDGYANLSVPDRATLGNMSPEYGATVGFCPVDGSTLNYLSQTGRDTAQVSFVERFCRAQGLLAEGAHDPRYSEVLELDLRRIEPAIAGPRNPEERRTLRTVPAFIRTFLDERARQSGPAAGNEKIANDGFHFSAPAGGMALLGELAKGGTASGLRDGSIIIAAITSCTNTSNPTVMVGAGLLAKNAVLKGLAPQPFVKCSLAPGSSVVKDYLERAGLLHYLDKLGFNLVGYGCTTCIAEGTPVLMSDGTARSIDLLPSSGGALIFGPTDSGRLGVAQQSRLINNGVRDCVELILQDGRTLTCTPDHRILCSDGRWVRADELVIGNDRVIVGLEGPRDNPGDDEAGYVLRAGSHTFRMDTDLDRARTLAFARLVGHLLNDGSISTSGQGRMIVGQALDRMVALNDVELLVGTRPAANRYDDRKWSIVLPMGLTRAIAALPGVQVGRRIFQPPMLPEFVRRNDCPITVVREFLGGLFGADGHAPILHRQGEREEDSTLEPPAFSQSTIPAHLERAKEMLHEIISLLARCGVETQGAQIYDYPVRRSESSYKVAQDGIPRIEMRLVLPEGLSFVEHVGFRYSVDKAMRASAAAVYWRLIDGIQRQRLWVAARLEELHQEHPTLPFSKARQLVAVSLLGHETEASLPPVVSPHFALLKGHDRFSRLPKPIRYDFRPHHRESCDFPSPVALFKEMGVRGWFAPLLSRSETDHTKRYCVEKEETTLPTFSLQVVGRRLAGQRQVYDLSVDGLHAFTAGTVAVHNCIGNSGPLSPEIEEELKRRDIYAVAVLSGNRNFDGRIHPLAKGSFLMSPMLVVAYALVGNIGFDFDSPLGTDQAGRPVSLRDIWPSLKDIKEAISRSVSRDLYTTRYAYALVGDDKWKSLVSSPSDTFSWKAVSSYVREPPWFQQEVHEAPGDIQGARVLLFLGDKVTTDHISPAGTIQVDSPAGKYLLSQKVQMIDFSTYGSRRGNHEVMVRGGFSNIRLRNALASGKEGGYTKCFPSGEVMTVFDAAQKYLADQTPLIILAGKQYGTGSSRDWAAKATKLLGVRAVIAESFERIHRSNLVAMGVLPIEFTQGSSPKTLGLTGEEVYSLEGLDNLSPGGTVKVTARSPGREVTFDGKARIDNAAELSYYRSGGVLPYVLNRFS